MALTFVACGDDPEDADGSADGERLTRTEFVAAMNDLCKERDAAADPLLGEGDFFAMEVGAEVWPKLTPIVEEFIDGVAELNPPADAAELHADYIEGGEAIKGAIEDAAAAADEREQRAYSKALAAIFLDIDHGDARIAEYGADECHDPDEALPQSEEPDPDATIVEIKADEYSFIVPEGITAGRTAFAMENIGDELHVFGFGRLKDGVTFAELRAQIDSGEEPDAFVEDSERITGVAGPDGRATTNAELIPGSYVAYCFLPAPDGTSHMELGMLVEFTVA